MIHLEIYREPPVKVEDEKLLFSLIRASFNQRRKTLVNSLNNASNLEFQKEEIAEALESMGISGQVRGEALTLEQFGALADVLSGLRKRR